MKKLLLSGLAIAVLFSCTREEEERPVFPSAEFYSPLKLQTGETIGVYGKNIEGATIEMGGEVVKIDSSSSDKNTVYFRVPAGSINSAIKVALSDGEDVVFDVSSSNDAANSAHVFLFTDFDGNGIRPINSRDGLGKGQWTSEVLPFGVSGVSDDFKGVKSSPAGGGFFYINNAKENRNNKAWDGQVLSRNEVNNDNYTLWPTSIADHELIPFDLSGQPNSFFVNFYFHSGGQSGNRLDVVLVNDKKTIENQFQYRFELEANNDWQKISVPLSVFKDNYGFGDAVNSDNLAEFNGLKFVTSRLDDQEEAESDAFVLLDHITLSEGKLY